MKYDLNSKNFSRVLGFIPGFSLRQSFMTWLALSNDTLRSKISCVVEKNFWVLVQYLKTDLIPLKHHEIGRKF